LQGTWGQHIHDDVIVPNSAFIIRKGLTTVVDSYGAFTNNYGMYLSSQKPSIMKRIEENSLRSTLKKLGIQHVYVAGTA